MNSNYVPSVQDILWSYTPTIGIHKSNYLVNGIAYQFLDVGGTRSERKKWDHAFHQNIQTVVFTIDVSCYDRVSWEDGSDNRMLDTFALWERVVNSDLLTKTNFVVMFMKEDRLTRAKLTKSPITTIFPEMSGDSKDPESVARYMVRHLKSMIMEKPDCNRSILLCSGGSIGQSTTDLAEITLDAIEHAAYRQQRFVEAMYGGMPPGAGGAAGPDPPAPGPIPRHAKFKWRSH